MKKVLLRLFKAICYVIMFGGLFLFYEHIGLSPALSLAALLGLIAAIANEHRSLPSVWETSDIYVLVCVFYKKEDADFPIVSYDFAKTRGEVQQLLDEKAKHHISELHKPVACSNGCSSVDFKDEAGNRWHYCIHKESLAKSI